MRQLLVPLVLLIASTGLYGQIDTIQNNEDGYSVRQKLNSVITTLNSLAFGYPGDSIWDAITTSIINDQSSGVTIDGTLISNNTIAPSNSSPANYMTADADELSFVITSEVMDIKSIGVTFDIRHMGEVAYPTEPAANNGVLYMSNLDEHLYFMTATDTFDLTQGTGGVGGDTVVLGTIAPLNSDSAIFIVFNGGGNNPGDSASFTTSTIYGSVRIGGSDTLVVVHMNSVLLGSSPSLTVDPQWHATLNSGSATHLNTTPPTITSTTTGDNDVSFNNVEIPPGVRIWCKTPTITTKPIYMEITLTCYKKNNQW